MPQLGRFTAPVSADHAAVLARAARAQRNAEMGIDDWIERVRFYAPNPESPITMRTLEIEVLRNLEAAHARAVRRSASPACRRCTAIPGGQLTSATLDSLTSNWHTDWGQVTGDRDERMT
jgi:hypothetical protein